MGNVDGLSMDLASLRDHGTKRMLVEAEVNLDLECAC